MGGRAPHMTNWRAALAIGVATMTMSSCVPENPQLVLVNQCDEALLFAEISVESRDPEPSAAVVVAHRPTAQEVEAGGDIGLDSYENEGMYWLIFYFDGGARHLVFVDITGEAGKVNYPLRGEVCEPPSE